MTRLKADSMMFTIAHPTDHRQQPFVMIGTSQKGTQLKKVEYRLRG
jgi:hypothetical protein